jgi:hypothetical protein
MEPAVTMSLRIDADWERLDAGLPEERACYAAIGIIVGDHCLTQAHDAFVNRVRDKIHLSAYRLAEWLAWNWWRLRWEPRTSRADWTLAHHMTTIGGGYVWPNITIISDGERVALVAKLTKPHPAEPLRYIAEIAAVVRAVEFESGIDRFLDQVAGQLRAERISDTNFDHVWREVMAERADPNATERRRIEAMLGFDPGEADPGVIDRLIADAAVLGRNAVTELAADDQTVSAVATPDRLRDVATASGFDAQPGHAARLPAGTHLPPTGQVPAWRRGADAAQALRAHANLGAAPISNGRLAELAGVGLQTLTDTKTGPDFTFALDEGPSRGVVVLRSKRETGRRFDLARLLGDRLATATSERLLPATRSSTYRQKLQRAFAAELLCPFEALDAMLRGDYSPESIEDAARHYNVSELTVTTLLVNHGRLERDDLEGDLEATRAA